MARETGVVKWFNPIKNFGFIIRNGAADVFVHLDKIQERRVPAIGEKLTFIVEHGSKGPSATDVKFSEPRDGPAEAQNIEPTALIAPLETPRHEMPQQLGTLVLVDHTLKIRVPHQQDLIVEPGLLPVAIRHLGNERKDIRVRFSTNAQNKVCEVNMIDQTPASGEFLHPYYFIPPAETTPADVPPPGHGSWASDCYSGKLHIKMTAITPLLVPDAAQYSESGGHKTFSTRVGADGKPLIAATSVKGMLRSAFEIITGSRMSVFSGHERRLGYRQSPQESLCLWPARITVNDDQIGVELFAGHATAVCLPGGHQANTHEFAVLGIAQNSRAPSAWWEKYLGDPNQKTYARRNEHGSAVFADIADMPRDGLPISRATNVVNSNGAIKSATQIEGWGSITNRSFSRKHDERVFFNSAGKIQLTAHESKSIRLKWRDLIVNFRGQHSKADIEERKKEGGGNWAPQDFCGRDPGRTAWSRHMYVDGSEHLETGTLCYVRLRWNNPTHCHPCSIVTAPPNAGRLFDGSISASDVSVDFLSPVQIGRELCDKSPDELLPKHLHPAKILAECSAADRVFGFVAQKQDQDSTAGVDSIYRGHVRFGVVSCLTDKKDATLSFSNDGLPLANLAAPKPAQGRFYLRSKQSAALKGESKSKTYKEGQLLAGHKVYPHQVHSAEYWGASKANQPWRDNGDASTGVEYRRAKNKDEERDTQNRSMRDWIAPNTKFEFDLHFNNLQLADFAALLWLLDLPKEHYHKLGGGKPYGFGSVRLYIDFNHSHWSTGTELAAKYKGFPAHTVPAETKESLVSRSQFAKCAQSEAFLLAAKGFGHDQKTHYPRRTLHPVQNEKDKFAHIYGWFGKAESSRKPALPLLNGTVSSVTLKHDATLTAADPAQPQNLGVIANRQVITQPHRPAQATPRVQSRFGPSWITKQSVREKVYPIEDMRYVDQALFDWWWRDNTLDKKAIFYDHIRPALLAIVGSYSSQAERKIAAYQKILISL